MSRSEAARRLQRIIDTPERRARLHATGRTDQIVRTLVESCHPKQRGFVEDEAKWIAAMCGARAGKTTGGRARFLRRMLRTPRARCLYIASTRGEAEELMWAPLKDLNDELELGATFAEQKLRMTLPNGSFLRLTGCDDRKQIEKLRGQPWHEVQIDEAASHTVQILSWLIHRVIGPRMGDFDGTLVMYGTPGHVLAGEFYDVTKPGSERGIPYARRSEPEFADLVGWSTHQWNAKDGSDVGVPAMISAWRRHLETKELNGWSDDHPVHRREHLGFWASDETEGVFRYRPDLDDGTPWNRWDPERDEANLGIAKLPRGGDWLYAYGMDMGHSDPFALEIGAIQPNTRELLHVYEFEKKGMTLRAIAELLVGKTWVKRILNGQDPGPARGIIGVTGWPYGMVADTAGLGTAMLQELSEVYGIPIEAAEKRDRHDAIELTNGDLLDPLDPDDLSKGARIKVLKDSQLEIQMQSLQWAIDPDGKLKQDKSQRNDCADAFTYMRRKIMHLVGAELPGPGPTREQETDAWLKRSAELAAARRDNDAGDEWPEGPELYEDDYSDDDWG